jgi:hypothetical protein
MLVLFYPIRNARDMPTIYVYSARIMYTFSCPICKKDMVYPCLPPPDECPPPLYPPDEPLLELLDIT